MTVECIQDLRRRLAIAKVPPRFFQPIPRIPRAMPDLAHTEVLRYNAGGKEFASYVASDPARSGKRPGIIVLPEWWGLNDYLRRRARELAGLGFVAMATDVYGDGREAADSTEAGQLMGGLFADIPSLNARLQAAYDQLRAHPLVDPERIGAMGYCLGGALSLHMGRLGIPLKGVASFHGALTRAHEAKKGDFKASVLICHGEADGMVPAEDQANFRKEMEELGVDYTFNSYPGAKHGFTNPEATEKGKKYNLPLAYDEKTDRQSWEDMKAFWSKAFR
jgi:dienelactone hydrolase